MSTAPAQAARATRPGRVPFRPDLQGLRAVAVLLVVGFHIGLPGLTGGFVGVDVFFVLSGFLITGILVHEIETTGRLDLVHFFARRAKRLLPGFALMLGATAVISQVVLSPIEQQAVSRTAFASAISLGNIWFVRNGEGYFATDATGNPLLHTWSLGVEEQFYLFWPIVLLLALRPGRSRRVAVAAIAALSALSFLWALELTRSDGLWAFYGSHARAWEFGVGGLIALIGSRKGLGRAACPTVLGWAGLAAILFAAFGFTHQTAFPGWAALLPISGTVAVLLAGSSSMPRRSFGAVLSKPLLQWVGGLSYSWYLWHWPFLVLTAAVMPLDSMPARVMIVLAALGAAFLSDTLVERPVREGRYLVRSSVLTLGVAAAVSTWSLGASLVWNRGARLNSLSPEQEPFTAAAAVRGPAYDRGCILFLDDSAPRECVSGVAEAEQSLVLFGDSHAAQWLPAVEQLAVQKGWRLVTLLKSGCPAASVTIRESRPSGSWKACEEWRTAALRTIAGYTSPTVITASASHYVSSPGRTGGRGQLSLQEWEEGSRRTFEALVGSGARVLAMRDTPIPGFNVPICLSRATIQPWPTKGACTVDVRTALRPEVFDAERIAAADFPQVEFLDLSDQFCDDTLCATTRDGVILYFDEDHLTPAGAAMLGNAFVRRALTLLDGLDGGSPLTLALPSGHTGI